jgi:hypothetical protein
VPSRRALVVVAALVPGLARSVPIHEAVGSLHGFPSMSDAAGTIVADGELTQQVRGDRLVVRARWRFQDGRTAEEEDAFRTRPELSQERFSWVERRGDRELRRFEVDFTTGRAFAATARGDHVDRRDARLDLPPGRSFTGYGTALAASELPLDAPGAKAELAFVAFTPEPRVVTLEVRRGAEEDVPAAHRTIACDRFTLHPKLPFPVSVVAHARDAHLWFTHRPPRALVRAEESLVAKDDPVVVIDVVPRGAARPAVAARPGRRTARPGARR